MLDIDMRFKQGILFIRLNGILNGDTCMKLEESISTLIEDNGIGMDEETLKNIKEMFYTTKQNGTGLGVALSNEIIKSHNGELLFTSELNKGTKVTIRLPY